MLNAFVLAGLMTANAAGDMKEFKVVLTPVISAKGCPRKAEEKNESWLLSRQKSGRWIMRVAGKEIIYAGIKRQGVYHLQSVVKKKGRILSTSIVRLEGTDNGLSGERMVLNTSECGYLYRVSTRD